MFPTASHQDCREWGPDDDLLRCGWENRRPQRKVCYLPVLSSWYAHEPDTTRTARRSHWGDTRRAPKMLKGYGTSRRVSLDLARISWCNIIMEWEENPMLLRILEYWSCKYTLFNTGDVIGLGQGRNEYCCSLEVQDWRTFALCSFYSDKQPLFGKVEPQNMLQCWKTTGCNAAAVCQAQLLLPPSPHWGKPATDPTYQYWRFETVIDSDKHECNQCDLCSSEVGACTGEPEESVVLLLPTSMLLRKEASASWTWNI